LARGVPVFFFPPGSRPISLRGAWLLSINIKNRHDPGQIKRGPSREALKRLRRFFISFFFVWGRFCASRQIGGVPWPFLSPRCGCARKRWAPISAVKTGNVQRRYVRTICPLQAERPTWAPFCPRREKAFQGRNESGPQLNVLGSR